MTLCEVSERRPGHYPGTKKATAGFTASFTNEAEGHAMTDSGRLEMLLGAAVIARWAALPRHVQQEIFEAAMAASARCAQSEDAMRVELAAFLHERHPRTAVVS
jgi:hypothetical protein